MLLTIFCVVCILFLASIVLFASEWNHWKQGFMENGKFISGWYRASFYFFRTGFLVLILLQGLVIYEIYTNIIEI